MTEKLNELVLEVATTDAIGTIAPNWLLAFMLVYRVRAVFTDPAPDNS
jgi:hypothetical protein